MHYAGPAYKYILQHLNAGANGFRSGKDMTAVIIIRTAHSPGACGEFMRINDTLHPDVYTPRAHYYTFKQLFHFVKPGFKRIDIKTTRLP